MKATQELRRDLLNISSALAAFSAKHNNSPDLKAHIDTQCTLLKKTKAIQGSGSESGLSARAIYGEPKVAATFEEALQRNGSIFIANELGQFISTHDAKEGLIALNDKLLTMSAVERDNFKQFMDSMSSAAKTQPVHQNFKELSLTYGLLFEGEDKNSSPKLSM